MKMTNSQKQKLEWIDGALSVLLIGYQGKGEGSRFSCNAMNGAGGAEALNWYKQISELFKGGERLHLWDFTDEDETGAGERYLWLAMLATLVKERVDEGIFHAGENSI